MNGRIYTYLIEVSIFSLFSLLSRFWFWPWSFHSRKLFLVINTISSYHNLGNYTWKLQYHALNARKQYDYTVRFIQVSFYWNANKCLYLVKSPPATRMVRNRGSWRITLFVMESTNCFIEVWMFWVNTSIVLSEHHSLIYF